MIGLGKWKCKINHTFYAGDAFLIIKDNNGEYDFSVILDGKENMPSYTISNLVENGNRLEGDLKIDMLPMKMHFYADFDGDKMSGGLVMPFVGEVKLENAERVEEE